MAAGGARRGLVLLSCSVACLPGAAAGPPEELAERAVEPGREECDEAARRVSLLQRGHAVEPPQVADSLPGSARLARERPNIVLWLPDDMFLKEYSWWLPEEGAPPMPSRLQTGGLPVHSDLVMPNLARIAQAGATFTKAHGASPMCTPSRYSIITGRYPSRSGYGVDHADEAFQAAGLPEGALDAIGYWVGEDSVLGRGYSDTQNTVAAALRTLGYTTGMMGKWHLTPTEEGGSFDSPYSKQTASVKEAGFDFVDGLYICNFCSCADCKFTHNLEWTLVMALRFMDGAMRSRRPFFLYFSPTPGGHAPGVMDALLGKRALYKTPGGALSEVPDVSQYCSSCTFAPRSVIWASMENISNPSLIGYCRDKLAALRWLDESLGVLYDFLSERGATANTYIVMATDHGPAKHSLYEAGTRVPMYAVGPSIRAGTVVEEIVSHVDLAPTFLEWASGGASRLTSVDGQSWAYVASGKASSLDRDGVYTEMMFDRAFVARNGMKYYNCTTTSILEGMGIHPADFGAPDLAKTCGAAYPHLYEERQVYDLTSDPTEQVNLLNM